MTDYQSKPVTMREIPGVGAIQQDGSFAVVGGCVGRSIITAADVLANPVHYFRTTYPQAFRMMETGEAAAFVLSTVNGKPAQIKLTQAEWAKGADERARYAAWMAGVVASNAERRAAERAYDAGMNEGGEGYNPHRALSERTYARTPRRDRDYPDNA